MPPVLALFLCTVFVLYTLRLERRLSRDVSTAVWIPILWILSIASKPIGIWFESAGADIESGSPLDRFFVSGLLCAGLWVLYSRKFEWGRVLRKNKWVAWLIVYMFVSILWSEFPFMSFKRWVRELTAVIMAFVLVSEASPRDAIECLFRRSLYILIPYSLLLIKYFPHYGRQYNSASGEEMWLGVATHKNSLGRLCIMAALFLTWSIYRRWHRKDLPGSKYLIYVDGFNFLITCWLLRGPGGAYSATAIVVCFLGLAMYFALLTMRKWRVKLGTEVWLAMISCIVLLGIALPVVAGGKTVGGGFAKVLGRDATLTGRTEIWGWFVPMALKRPFLGSGYGGFWTTQVIEDHEGEFSSHNGYLDTWLQLGAGGLCLVGMFILSSCSKICRMFTSDFDWAALWMCYLFMATVHNWTETSISSFTAHITAILLFLYVSDSRGRVTPLLRVSRNKA